MADRKDTELNITMGARGSIEGIVMLYAYDIASSTFEGAAGDDRQAEGAAALAGALVAQTGFANVLVEISNGVDPCLGDSSTITTRAG